MLTEKNIEQAATSLGKTFLAAAKEAQEESSKVYFVGSIYEVRVLYEGTSKEKLIIYRDGWDKPLILGGVGDGSDYVEIRK